MFDVPVAAPQEKYGPNRERRVCELAALASAVFGTPLGAHAMFDPVFAMLVVALLAVATWSAWLARRVPGPGMLRLLPYGSVVAATFILLAAGIYLLTTTAWATAVRTWLRRGDGEAVRR